MSCCIEGCEISSTTDVSLFEFPTSRLLRKRWLDAINPGSKLDLDAVICSRHFLAEDYEDVRGKVRLKSKVVPSLFGDKSIPTEDPMDPLQTTKNGIVTESTKDSEENDNDNDNHNGKDNNYSESENERNDSSDSECNRRTAKKRRRRSKKVVKRNTKVDRKRNVNSDDEKDTYNDKHVENVDINEKVDNDNEKVDNDNVKVDNHNVKVGNDDETFGNNDEKVGNDDEKLINDGEKVINDDDNGKSKETRKRVKTKVVPYRKVGTPALNRVLRNSQELSEDSSSQDSVNSSLPPEPSAKEDIEDIIANYQIENKKTERQIAAMIPEEPVCEEGVTMEAEVDTGNGFGLEIAPVFIELSVGQDMNMGSEQPNDCLMVLESVQCEVDPALLLAAREEDEECLEQIDLDDDNDEVSFSGTITEAPKKVPKRNKLPVDPISLLTSSDEDDVIIQEPKIDTLSVSDETDEDDVPLTRLIKPKTNTIQVGLRKYTKKDKPDKLNAILCGKPDFYCMHCNKVCESRYALKIHVATHVQSYEEPVTKVYQICKDCGFTTSSKSQLSRHQKKHSHEKKYKCPLCSYKSKYNMSLMYHLKTHDFDPNMYNCGACGLELADKKSLLQHQKECYAIEERFVCGKCGFVAKTKKLLKTHRRDVHKQK